MMRTMIRSILFHHAKSLPAASFALTIILITLSFQVCDAVSSSSSMPPAFVYYQSPFAVATTNDSFSSVSSSSTTTATSSFLSSPLSKGFILRRSTAAASSSSSVDTTTTTTTTTSDLISNKKQKVLVLGGSGFVGSEIVRQLKERGIPYIATSTTTTTTTDDHDNNNKMIQLDLTSIDAKEQVKDIVLSNDCTSIISTVGSILTSNDIKINSASGIVADAIKDIKTINKFVFIGNSPKVRNFAKNISPLKDYTIGKEESERIIRNCLEENNRYCIIQPTFIYGGDDFGTNPPRLPSNIGQVAEDILGLYPIQALSDALPGVLSIATEAPVSRERIATASINVALGLCGNGLTELSTRDDIILAAAKRQPKQQHVVVDNNTDKTATIDSCSDESKDATVIEELKLRLFNLGDCSNDEHKLREAFDILEEIESYKPISMKPSIDSTLVGRWNFVFDVEPDMGTGIIKQILEGNSPIKPIFDLNDVYMEIIDHHQSDTETEINNDNDNNNNNNRGGGVDGHQQRMININVSITLFGKETNLILTTSIKPDTTDPSGTMLMEKFENIQISSLGDMNMPIPQSWKRQRPLEISYVDDDIMIARGNGGEPHFLLRG